MSKQLSGRCLNVGNCEIANSVTPIQVEASADFICTECGKPLVANQTSDYRIHPLLMGVIGAGVIGTSFIIFGLTNTLKPRAIFPPENTILRLAGSNTLGAKLAPALVEAFFKDKGCTKVTRQTVETELIKVTCGLDGKDYLASISFKGSGTAFTGLKDGSADIGMASRRAKPAEVASLTGQGDLTSPANEHVVALDGVAIIVNPSNQVPRLSIAQARSIFAGNISYFSLVDGPSIPINLYRRDDKSGTYDSFKSLVMDGTPIASSAKAFEDSNALSSALTADRNGIGFVGHTLAGDARIVPIGASGQQVLLPNRFTIQTEDYPLSRRLYFYTLSEAGNKEVARFISFANSKAGQAVVDREKFIPLEIVRNRAELPWGSSRGYQAVTAGTERLSVNFRFNSGSNQLDNRALADLDRVTEYLIRTSTKPNKLILIGFTDNVGDPALNVILSKERAKSLANSLKTRGIIPGQITGFGAENPIASNDTLSGQQKNRRVEVWVTR
jgi:phosphate transport system substrate-binding protein